jgi:hypothetical protein
MATYENNDYASKGVGGTLPVARGGTGITSNPSMKTNLGSTSAADVFASSPRPGVTGTLGVGNGGTGLTSNPSMKTNLGSTSAADVFVASPRPGVTGTLGEGNGSTGKTNLVDALNKAVNDASEGTTPAYEQDFVLAQYAGGGTSTKTYHRRRAATIATSPYRKEPSTTMGMNERVLTVKDSIPSSWDGSSDYYWNYQYKDFIPFKTISANSTSFSDSPQSCVRWYNTGKTINLSEFTVGVSYIIVLQQKGNSNYALNIKNDTGSSVSFYETSSSTSVANGSNYTGLLSGPTSSNNVLWNNVGSVKVLYRSGKTSCFVFNSY